MATKNTVTRATALSAAIEIFKSKGMDDYATTLEKMLASITRKADRPAGPSKAAIENAQLADKVLAYLPVGVEVSGSDIVEHVPGIMRSQKLTQVMKPLIESGKVEKVKIGRHVGYKLV